MLDKTKLANNNNKAFFRRLNFMKLVIVESPHKSTTISNFLGSDYKVIASKGHIRDLTTTGKGGLGVDVEHDFKATYAISPDKKDIVSQLKKLAKQADVIYLATDPDREGEAISWHLAQVLDLDVDTTPRLEFHEITKNAIRKALNNPRTINMNLVQSQEARRILDRIIGFKLSGLMDKKVKSKSAGRVQSPVLKFIVDREKEIRDFTPVEYWTISADFSSNKSKVKADLKKYNGKEIKINNVEEADNVISNLGEKFTVSDYKTDVKTIRPQPPFITSTLQQEAFSKLRMSTKKCAATAQILYEGKEINGVPTGLITYIRTDSIRLADEFVYSCKDFISKEYGQEYLGNTHFKKSNDNVQDAHEAIRPTDISLTPATVKPYLNNDEYKLYTLIYNRAVASLMADKKNEVATLTFSNNGYDFVTTSSKVIFKGYSAIYGSYEEEEEKNKLPDNVKINDVYDISNINKEQHFTKAPSRYNEGKIVRLMQDNLIGRPSTYASTIDRLITNKYIVIQERNIQPTQQGEITVESLEEYFNKYIDANYTANVEKDLDNIADGKIDKVEFLNSFWAEFEKYYTSAAEKMAKIPPKVVEDHVCPNCGSKLIYRIGRTGEFIGCSNYPTCKYTEKIEKEEIVEGRLCPKCGGQLVYRTSKRRKGSKFIGCSNFGSKHCDYMEDLDGHVITRELPPEEGSTICPKCGEKHLITVTSKAGKKYVKCSHCHYFSFVDDNGNPIETKPVKKTYSRKK